MAGPPPVLVVLDGASALLTLAVAAGFLWLARWSGRGLHLLVAAGFATVAAGFLLVAVSHYGGGLEADALDVLRMALQLGGAVLLALAYGSSHLTGRTHAAGVVGGSLATVAGLILLAWWLPPRGDLAFLPASLAVTHALMTAAYVGCALLSGYGWHQRPTWGRAMVPLGFLAWSLSTYTWVLIDLGPDDRFLPLAYVWRFAAILLLLWAMVRRPRRRPEVAPPAEA